MERVSTGLKTLDKLLNGGFPEYTTVLLSGGPGTGKTLLALNYLLEGARKGERCCYLSLNETPEELIRACKTIKSLSDVDKYLGRNLVFEYIPFEDGKITIDQFVRIMENYPELDRFVLDNVNKLLVFSKDMSTYRINFARILKNLRNIKSRIIICETENEKIDSGNFEAFECDGVIQLSILDIEEKPKRLLTIHKMRFTGFEPKIPHELSITQNNIELKETVVMWEG